MDQERLSKLAGITEIEINPGDEIANHLNDIEEYINDEDLVFSEMAMRILDAVAEIRNKLNWD
jgi:hypothetical protein